MICLGSKFMLFNNQVCKDRQKMERYFKTDFKKQGATSVGKWRGGAGSRWHAWRGCRRVFWS
ncbi:MAG TPA: hypothetical protein DCZ73_08035, partial [Bacteroides sp.]|nr:hypothetical protein [Bacteroides sp.]